jgi:hypothetical protein
VRPSHGPHLVAGDNSRTGVERSGQACLLVTCCILHNMILEDEAGVEGLEDILGDLLDDAPLLQRGLTFDELVQGQI